MWRRLLLVASLVNIAYEVSRLWGNTARRLKKKRAKSCGEVGGEDRISALPDDLLVRILMFVPTKKVVATMILSKRWRFIWTMVPQLFYREINHGIHKGFLGGLLGRLLGKQQQSTVWRFLDESLRAHKAPVLETLLIELGPQCPIDVDVGKWIENAVERRVRVLAFGLIWSAKPTSLPKSVYTCHTLFHLYLVDKILVDVPSPACLPSLQYLNLSYVVYKDEDSHVRLFSSCPNLKCLSVERHRQDNVTKFFIKVQTLERLFYDYVELGVPNGSLVINSPTIKRIVIRDFSGGSCSIENEPRFDKAVIHVHSYPDNKFMRSLSSVMSLELLLEVPTAMCCNSINFSQLIDCRIILQDVLDWLEPLMLLLQNSSNLKVLLIHKATDELLFPLSWNQPSSVPGCLSSHLEIFEWKEYGGRSEEKEVVRYIFSNSKCLKRAGFTIKSTCNLKDKMKMMIELESMSRVSASSQLLFSTQLGPMNYRK